MDGHGPPGVYRPTYTFVAPANAGPYDVNVNVYYTTGNVTKDEKKAIEKNKGVPPIEGSS
jgi:hypothetical protein